MLVENRLAIAKIRLAYLLCTVLPVVLVIFSLFEGGGWAQNVLGLWIAGALLLVYGLMNYLGLRFIYYSDEEKGKKKDFLVFRHYNIHPFLRKYMAFEIPKKALVGFQIHKSFGGFKRSITFRQLTRDGSVFDYPPVSISALPQAKVNQLAHALAEQVKDNQKGRTQGQ